MRLLPAACLLVVAATAIAFTWLNAGTTTVDFYFARASAPLGIVLIAVLATGWLLGGITAWLGEARRQRSRARSSETIANCVAAQHPDQRGIAR